MLYYFVGCYSRLDKQVAFIFSVEVNTKDGCSNFLRRVNQLQDYTGLKTKKNNPNFHHFENLKPHKTSLDRVPINQ